MGAELGTHDGCALGRFDRPLLGSALIDRVSEGIELGTCDMDGTLLGIELG